MSIGSQENYEAEHRRVTCYYCSKEIADFPFALCAAFPTLGCIASPRWARKPGRSQSATRARVAVGGYR